MDSIVWLPSSCHPLHAHGLHFHTAERVGVDQALHGSPGVLSARYSGKTGPRNTVDPANNTKLLQELRNTPTDQRTARFVCALCYAQPDASQQAITVRGTVEGRILLPDECSDPAQPHRGRGTHGFGYDPLFQLPDDHPRFPSRTTAELSPDDKNSLSHRGEAARLIWTKLRETID